MNTLALSDEILLTIDKPARYIGNELNMVKKNPKDVDIRFAMCFPDVYEIGMSHLGIQILYDMFNKFNHPICKISRLLEVIKADETVSDLLNIEKDSPIFYFHSYGKDKQQNVIEYSISKYRGDINSFLFDLTKID